MEINNIEIGKRLVKLRGNKTQEEVAENVGISKSALAMYESGKRIPRDTIKIRLCDFYNVNLVYLFFGEKDHVS